MKKAWLYLFFCFAVGLLHAQELVKDINTYPSSFFDRTYYDNPCIPCGNYTFFYRWSTATGRDLWRTDGTTAGTILLKDMGDAPPPFNDPNIYHTSCNSGQLYFFAESRIWKSDGTVAGTAEAVSRVSIFDQEIFNNKLYYSSNTSVYVSTGVGNETLLKDFATEYPSSAMTLFLFPAGDKLYIFARESVVPGLLFHLWVSDGTSTQFIKTFEDWVYEPVILNGKIIFNAADGTGLRKLWATDGTTAGTVLLKDTDLQPIGLANGKAHFTGGSPSSVWASDGTSAGTVKVLDGYTGSSVVQFAGNLYFSTTKGAREVLKVSFDYSTKTTVATSTQEFGTIPIGVVNGKLFVADYASPTGDELYSIDASGNKVLIKDILPGTAGSLPRSFSSIGNSLLFIANDGVHGFEFWKSDGTNVGTVLLKDIASGTEPSRIWRVHAHNQKLYFFASQDENHEEKLWMSDGTTAGTNVLYDPDYNAPMPLAEAGKYVVFTEMANNTDLQVLKTDLETGQTSILSDPPAGANGLGPIYPSKSVAVGNSAYFLAGGLSTGPKPGTIDVWHVDPATNNLSMLTYIHPTSSSYAPLNPLNGIALGNKLIFSADSPEGVEPWVSDGTEAGTFMLSNIEPNGDSSPNYFVRVGNKVFFKAHNQASGGELWVTDGTVAGTKMVIDLRPGNGQGVTSFSLAALANGVVFGGYNDQSKSEPFFSDGTPQGTRLLKDILPNAGSGPNYFMSAGDKVYFACQGALWITDGSEAGTKQVTTQTGALFTDTFVANNGALYFLADGGKIWRTVGTAGSTRLLATVKPTSQLFIIGQYLYFINDDEHTGTELYKIKLPDPETQTISFTGFTNLRAGDPQTARIESSSGFPVSASSSDATVAEYVNNQLVIHKSGTITFTVTQAGNDYFLPITSTKEVTILPVKQSQTITFPTIGTKAYADPPFNTGASTNSALPLTYQSSNETIATISADGKITIKKSGQTQITISQAGNDYYHAAAPAVQTLFIEKAAQTITAGAVPAQSVLNPPFKVNASASSGLPVVFSAIGTVVSVAADGTVTINRGGTGVVRMNQAGNENYLAAPVLIIQFTITKVSQAITFGPLEQKTVGNDPFFLTATASSQLPVTYESSNQLVATVAADGKVTLVGAGTTQITAKQAGDGIYNAATPVVQDLLVNSIPVPKLDQEITFHALGERFANEDVTIDATTTSGLQLTFSSSDESIATVNSAGNVSIRKSGEVTITVTQPGNDVYNAAAPVSRLLKIVKTSQTISFPELSSIMMNNQPFALQATASSALAVSYESSSHISINGNEATIKLPGKATITAVQTGNEKYNAATKVSRTFCINPLKPHVTLELMNGETKLKSTAPANVWMVNDQMINATGDVIVATESGAYKAAAIVEGCQGEFFGLTVVVTAVEDTNSVLEVFPNPATNTLTIKSSEGVIRVMDAFGRQHFYKKINTSETTLDVSSFGAGLYFVVVTDGVQTNYTKFIKQ